MVSVRMNWTNYRWHLRWTLARVIPGTLEAFPSTSPSNYLARVIPGTIETLPSTSPSNGVIPGTIEAPKHEPLQLFSQVNSWNYRSLPKQESLQLFWRSLRVLYTIYRSSLTRLQCHSFLFYYSDSGNHSSIEWIIKKESTQNDVKVFWSQIVRMEVELLRILSG